MPHVKSNKAFTLIEILVVLFIIVSIFTITSRKLYSKDKKIKTAFVKLIRLNRKIQTLAEIHRNTYRLTFQINKDKPDKYWVEKQTINQKDEDGEAKTIFTIDEIFFSEPEKFNPMLNITAVETISQKDEVDSGSSGGNLFYIYYYPKSLAQETAIQVVRRNHQGKWTLYLDPIKKDLQLLSKEKSLEQIREFLR